MPDRKTERLINLTLALLATKRYLKKSEILANVFGYEGNSDAKERMFERDKDDLRSLGIEIEVGDLDVFFEDEPGYRISQQSYQLNMPDLTPRELALISMASGLWNDSIMAEGAQSGVRKLKSLGIPTSLEFDFKIKYRFENPKEAMLDATTAIIEKRTLSFNYESNQLSERKIEPYRVLFWNGHWYLIGKDLDRDAIRIFKISRVVSNFTLGKKSSAYDIPDNFDVLAYLPKRGGDLPIKAEIEILKDSALLLRERAVFLRESGNYDLYEILFENEQTLIRELLWHGTNIKVLAPQSLQLLMIEALVRVSK